MTARLAYDPIPVQPVTFELWRDQAMCRGRHDLFFGPPFYERKDDRERREAKAKAICGMCPVEADCLDFALGLGDIFGVWGGTSPAERRKIIDRQTNVH